MDRHMLNLPAELSDPAWERVFERCEDMLSAIVAALDGKPEQQNAPSWIAYLAFLSVLERTGMDVGDTATALAHATATAAENISLRAEFGNAPGDPAAMAMACNVVAMTVANYAAAKLAGARPAGATVQ